MSENPEKTGIDRVAAKWLMKAGLLEAPPAMVRAVTEWVLAVRAATQMEHRVKDEAYLGPFLRPGVKSLPAGRKTVTKKFPMDLTGWSYARAPMIKSLKKLPSAWASVSVTLAWAASSEDRSEGGWDPKTRTLTIKFRFQKDLKMSKLEDTVRHELQHMTQTFMGSLLGGTEGTKPRPGMPSRHVMTPEHNQAEMKYDDSKSFVENYLLDDAEFYAQLTDMVHETQRHLKSVKSLQDRRDYLRQVMDGDKAFVQMQVWKKYAPGKWRKALKEFSRAFPAEGTDIRSP
jgi:hypothetical protein